MYVSSLETMTANYSFYMDNSTYLNVEFDNGLQRFVERDSSESTNSSKLNLRGIWSPWARNPA